MLTVHAQLGEAHPALAGQLGDRRPLRRDPLVLIGVGDQDQP